MKPVGLTMKHGRNKYRLEKGGELMLVHQCTDCGTLSINRIASDDDPSRIDAVFESSIRSNVHALCEQYGILTLKEQDTDVLHKQLYGRIDIPVAVW
jgi:hypothetical protein